MNYSVLGLMSGTSMDGLDCGLFNISLDNKFTLNWECADFQTIPYNEKVRSIIRAALGGDFLRGKIADAMLGQIFALYAARFLNGRKIDLIGSHGQTISHKDKHVSIQAGDPQYLYSEFNVPIVYDFRQADIDVGGNGAPLMPFLDWLLFRNLGSHTITLNVGGIANLTFIPKKSKKENVTGFDTGPGMALIDECCREYYNRSMDKDGKFGRKGKVDSKLLDVLMKHPFITKIPPKSTGRDEFSEEMVKSIREKYPQISTNDFIRTLAAFSAKSISYNVEKYANFNTNKSKLIVSGGGVYHPIFMEDLKNFCSALKIHSSQEIGIDPNMKESLLIAVLAVAKFKGIASNMRSVTGALRDVPLGKIYKEIE